VAFNLQKGQTRLFPHFPVKIGLFWGVGGVPEFLFLLESSYFCYLGAHAKIWNPTTTPFGVLATAVTRKQQEEEYETSPLCDTGSCE
jgi:hypothetical protein